MFVEFYNLVEYSYLAQDEQFLKAGVFDGFVLLEI